MTFHALDSSKIGDEYTRRNPGRQIDIRTFDHGQVMPTCGVYARQNHESGHPASAQGAEKAAEDDRFAGTQGETVPEQVEAELKTTRKPTPKPTVRRSRGDQHHRHAPRVTAPVIEHSLATEVKRPSRYRQSCRVRPYHPRTGHQAQIRL